MGCPDLPPYDSFVDLLEEAAMGDIIKAMDELHEAWPAIMNRNNMRPVLPPTIRGTAHQEREFLETEAIPLSDFRGSGPWANIEDQQSHEAHGGALEAATGAAVEGAT